MARRKADFLLPVGAAVLVYTLFALSNRAFFNALPLWDIPLSDGALAVLNLFRTSGRFIWPVFYLLMLFVIVVIMRRLRSPLPVLLLALLVQYADLQPLIAMKKQTAFVEYQTSMQSEFWQSAAETNLHIVAIPAKKLTQAYEPLALYAVNHGLTLNLGYFARSDAQAFQAYADQVWQDLQANRLDNQTIYILTDEQMIAIARTRLAGNLFVCQVGGYTVLLSQENDLSRSGFDLSPYCASRTQGQ
jgi:hypothetical protein